MLNYLQVYLFIKMLTKSYTKWPAYQAGVIDEKGNVLIPERLRTPSQVKSFSLFDRLVLGIRKRLTMGVGGATMLSSFAAALYLIEEHKMFTCDLREDFRQVELDSLIEFVEELTTTSSALAVDGTWSPPSYKRKRRNDNFNDDEFERQGFWAINPY